MSIKVCNKYFHITKFNRLANVQTVCQIKAKPGSRISGSASRFFILVLRSWILCPESWILSLRSWVLGPWSWFLDPRSMTKCFCENVSRLKAFNYFRETLQHRYWQRPKYAIEETDLLNHWSQNYQRDKL